MIPQMSLLSRIKRNAFTVQGKTYAYYRRRHIACSASLHFLLFLRKMKDTWIRIFLREKSNKSVYKNRVQHSAIPSHPKHIYAVCTKTIMC